MSRRRAAADQPADSTGAPAGDHAGALTPPTSNDPAPDPGTPDQSDAPPPAPPEDEPRVREVGDGLAPVVLLPDEDDQAPQLAPVEGEQLEPAPQLAPVEG